MNQKSELTSSSRKETPVWETDGNELIVETQRKKKFYRSPKLPSAIVSVEKDDTCTDFLKIADFKLFFPQTKSFSTLCDEVEAAVKRLKKHNMLKDSVFVHFLTYGTNLQKKKYCFILSWYAGFDEEKENIEDLKLLLPLVLEKELHPVILEKLGDEEEENER